MPRPAPPSPEDPRARWRRLRLVPLVVLLAHGAANLSALSREGVTSGCDVIPHLYEYARFVDDLQQSLEAGDRRALADIQWNADIPIWPRTVYFGAFFVQAITGDSHRLFVWLSGMLFLTLVVLATYKLGQALYDARVGAVACVLVSLAPGIYGLSRKFGLDLPITGLLTLCFWRLSLLDARATTGRFVRFGVLAGLCLLVKVQSIFLLVVPFFAWLVPVVRRAVARRRAGQPATTDINVVGILTVPLLAAAVSSLYWGGHEARLLSQLLSHSVAGEAPNPSAVFPDQPVLYRLFYLASAPVHLSPPLLLGLGLAALRFTRREWRLAAIYILPPLLFFSLLVTQKWGRYLFPTIPWVAVLVAAAIMSLDRPRRRAAATAALLLAGGIFYVSATFVELPGLRWFHEVASSGRLTAREATYGQLTGPSNHLDAVFSVARDIEPRVPAHRQPRIAVIHGRTLMEPDGCFLIGYGLRFKLDPLYMKCPDPDFDLAEGLPYDFFVVVEGRQDADRAPDAAGAAPTGPPTPISSPLARALRASRAVSRNPLWPGGGHLVLRVARR